MVARARQMGSLVGWTSPKLRAFCRSTCTRQSGFRPVHQPEMDVRHPRRGRHLPVPRLIPPLHARGRGLVQPAQPFNWDITRFALAPDIRRFDSGTPGCMAAIASLPRWTGTPAGPCGDPCPQPRLYRTIVRNRRRAAPARADTPRGTTGAAGLSCCGCPIIRPPPQVVGIPARQRHFRRCTGTDPAPVARGPDPPMPVLRAWPRCCRALSGTSLAVPPQARHGPRRSPRSPGCPCAARHPPGNRWSAAPPRGSPQSRQAIPRIDVQLDIAHQPPRRDVAQHQRTRPVAIEHAARPQEPLEHRHHPVDSHARRMAETADPRA